MAPNTPDSKDPTPPLRRHGSWGNLSDSAGTPGRPQTPAYHPQFLVFTFLALVGSCFKLLLYPAYKSTDFEVHRNWLAITFSKPLHVWYGEASESEWTLDYPPFFAYFEWCMAQVAYFVDPLMLDVQNLNYDSKATVLFQRITVIFTDLLLLYGIYLYSQTWPRVRLTETARTYSKTALVASLTFLNPGLLMVDHVHFQYNGVMVGLFIISLAFIKNDSNKRGALAFAVLLCMKHIFLYMAPVYFVYLFRHHCFDLQAGCTVRRHIPDKYEWDRGDEEDEDEEIDQEEGNSDDEEGSRQEGNSDGAPGSDDENYDGIGTVQPRERSPSLSLAPKTLGKFKMTAFFELGGIVLCVFILAFSPILVSSFNEGGEAMVIKSLQQIVGRLFPFQRGLTHAYWAPNVWAEYNLLDKVTLIGLKRFPGVLNTTIWGRGLLANINRIDADLPSTTSGQVGVVSGHRILPNISGGVCMVLTLASMVPVLWKLWKSPHPKAFVHAVVYAQLCSFMLGYHVHEKAILIAILPMSLLACDSVYDARIYLIMSSIGHLSLFPLLYEAREAPLQLFAFCAHIAGAYLALDSYHRTESSKMRIKQSGIVFSTPEKCFLVGLVFVYLFYQFHPRWIQTKMPFLPLLVMSTYCAFGNIFFVWTGVHDLFRRRLKVIEAYI
jgi:alpha-1,3-glucosyltransferase